MNYYQVFAVLGRTIRSVLLNEDQLTQIDAKINGRGLNGGDCEIILKDGVTIHCTDLLISYQVRGA